MNIDLDFRPASYSDFDGPVALALNGINGQMRRVMVRDMLTVTGADRAHYDATLGSIDPAILEEQSDPDRLLVVNRALGPSWLGGEYLPRRKGGEVEIARVVLDSVLMDVFSLRARRGGGRYHYRLVEEYQGSYRLCRKTSMHTLSLRQVIEVLQTAEQDGWDVGGRGIVECWWHQQLSNGDDPQRATRFAWVESEIYPGLPAWYDQRARSWSALHTGQGVEP